MEAAFAAAWFNPPTEPQRATPIQSAVHQRCSGHPWPTRVLSVRACGPLRNHGPAECLRLATSLGTSSSPLPSPDYSGPCLLRDPSALTVASAHPWAPATGIHAGTTHPYPPAIPGRPRLGVARTIAPAVRSGHRCAASLLEWNASWPFILHPSAFILPAPAAPLPWPPLSARCLRSAILAPLASEPGSMAQATPRRRTSRTNRPPDSAGEQRGNGRQRAPRPQQEWKPRPEFRRRGGRNQIEPAFGGGLR